MKIDSDSPSKVKGVALTLEKNAGCRVSINTMAAASRVTSRLRRAMRLAIEPLSENSTPSRLGLDLTIIEGRPLDDSGKQGMGPVSRRSCS